MVKKCDKQPNKLAEYLDKKMDLEKKGLSYIDVEMERHIANCAYCQREMEAQQDLFDTLSELEQIEPPADFTAQLMAKLPQPTKQKLPHWIFALGAMMLSASSTVLFIFIFWLFRFTDQMDFIKTFSNSVVIKAWELIKYAATSIFDFSELFLGVLKVIGAIIRAYPVSSLTMAIVGVLLFITLIKLINSFQSENFA